MGNRLGGTEGMRRRWKRREVLKVLGSNKGSVGNGWEEVGKSREIVKERVGKG